MLFYIDSLPENCIIAGSTNYKKNIDPALIRSGRLDVVIEIKNQFTKPEVKEFFDKMLFPNCNYNEFLSNFLYYETGSTIESVINKIKGHLALEGNIDKLFITKSSEK